MKYNFSSLIGFDCEWSYNTQTYQLGKIATIQIADNNCVLVLYVFGLGELPSSLCKLLKNESVVKLGRGVNGDLSNIQRDFKIVCKGDLELGAFCKDKGVIHNGRLGIAAICEAVSEHSLDKDQSITLGSRDALELTQAQISFAAIDAWASLNVFEDVNSSRVIGIYIWEPTADDEVNKDRVIVKIMQVLVPGAMVTAHDEYLRAFGNSPFEVDVRLSKRRTYKNVPVQQPAPTTIISEVNNVNNTPNEPDDDEENSLNQDEELLIIDEEENLLEVDDREIAELSRAYGQQQLQQQ
ncbi:hypothetical protein INT45_009359 [Circinella minor]|uniref:3'-5' exonuclease n=1 Tax=Circinella minor TaxID=1195481 RepID=A0A8H7S6W8_9FUNG|nr:hypothetical protein INT45_009359 [Circinella minor]